MRHLPCALNLRCPCDQQQIRVANGLEQAERALHIYVRVARCPQVLVEGLNSRHIVGQRLPRKEDARLLTGRLAVLQGFGQAQWLAGLYLGVAGGALAFILWVLALQRASPTRVATTMTVNPIAAALLAQQLVGEPLTVDLLLGLVAVFAGIWIATTTQARRPAF